MNPEMHVCYHSGGGEKSRRSLPSKIGNRKSLNTTRKDGDPVKDTASDSNGFPGDVFGVIYSQRVGFEATLKLINESHDRNKK